MIVDSKSKGESRNIYLDIKSEGYRLIIKGKPESNFAILMSKRPLCQILPLKLILNYFYSDVQSRWEAHYFFVAFEELYVKFIPDLLVWIVVQSD